MQNKKTIMVVSALFILIFHLWVNITTFIEESIIRQICVVGVDLFFFVSAYSISKKKEIIYKDFIINRLTDIYLKFILLTIIYVIYTSKGLLDFIKIILGIDLFTKGGGSFLWFLPSIMIIYVLLPLYKNIDNKYKKLCPIISFVLFLILSISLSTFTNYSEIFILLNRIPIIMLGYYIAKYNVLEILRNKKIIYAITTILLVLIGYIISYKTIFNRIEIIYLYDIKYILNIPLELGLIMLLDLIKDNKVTSLFGSITLELYGLQMIFGFKLANKLFISLKNPILVNIVTFIIIILLSLIMYYLYKLAKKLIKRIF